MLIKFVPDIQLSEFSSHWLETSWARQQLSNESKETPDRSKNFEFILNFEILRNEVIDDRPVFLFFSSPYGARVQKKIEIFRFQFLFFDAYGVC